MRAIRLALCIIVPPPPLSGARHALEDHTAELYPLPILGGGGRSSTHTPIRSCADIQRHASRRQCNIISPAFSFPPHTHEFRIFVFYYSRERENSAGHQNRALYKMFAVCQRACANVCVRICYDFFYAGARRSTLGSAKTSRTRARTVNAFNLSSGCATPGVSTQSEA